METIREQSPSAATESAVQEHHSLNTVRDLLFGSQSREINDRISRLEEKLASAISDVETRLSRQFENLEMALRGEIGNTHSKIDSKIDSGRSELDQRDAATGEEVKALGATLNDRFSQLTQSIERIESEGRLLLFERLKSLKDEFGDTSREWNERLDRELGTLRDAAAPRSELGQRLIELGQSLATVGGKAPDTAS